MWHYLEPDSWNISLSMSFSSESSDSDFIIVVQVIEATISWNVGWYFLAILLEQYSDAFSDGWVGLFGFTTLINWQYTPIFSTTIPLAWEAPMKGFLYLDPIMALLYYLSAHLLILLWSLSFLPALIPRGFPTPMLSLKKNKLKI